MEDLLKRVEKVATKKETNIIIEKLKKDIEKYKSDMSSSDYILFVANLLYDVIMLRMKNDIDDTKLLGALEYRNLIEEGKIHERN